MAMRTIHYFLLRLSTMIILCEGFQQQSPCPFNRLCNCLKPDADVGTITCINVPMIILPHFNRTFMNELRLNNNGLRILGEKFLVQTGLQKLQIKHNLITRYRQFSLRFFHFLMITNIDNNMITYNILY